MHRRVCAADRVIFFSAVQARKLSPSTSLELEEEALKRDAWDSDGDAASLELFLWVFGRSPGSNRVWAIELVENTCL